MAQMVWQQLPKPHIAANGAIKRSELNAIYDRNIVVETLLTIDCMYYLQLPG